MDLLEKELKRRKKEIAPWRPRLFNVARAKDRRALSVFMKTREARWVVDDYIEQLCELFAIRNPRIANAPEFEESFQKFLRTHMAKTPLAEQGTWAYFPWLATIAHILPDKDFQAVRTARNRYLINDAEQEKFYKATVGIAGLSVGSSVALAIALQGGGRHIRLADHDRLALSNMNRIRAGVQSLGALKVEMVARQIYEMNPYAKVEIMPDGLTPKNISRFFAGLDIVVDEIDNLAMKYLIREQAKKRRLAVVMAADNGDNAVVDVERYDRNPHTPFFHGRLGRVSYQSLVSLNKFGIGKMITKHVGPENVTERMRASLLQMGKTIVSWPQLGGAAMMNGAAVAYCVRKILNGQPLESNRALVGLDEKLVPGYHSAAARKRRKKDADAFRKIFGL